MSEGQLHYSEGVQYHEHHGWEVKVLGGQEMIYILGTENKQIIGGEAKCIVGAVADLGLATKVVFETTAEVMWVGGKHFVMAAHGGGIYDGAFSATAGFTNPIEFKQQKFFFKATVVAQALVTAASAVLIKTAFKPHEHNKHIEINATNAGFLSAVTVNAQLLSLAALVLLIVLGRLTKKQSHAIPLSAVTVTKQGYAFLGVSATPVAGCNNTGSAGLELNPLSFKLSWDDSQREFSTQGHHVSGYSGDGKSQIVGDSNGVAIDSNFIELATNTDKQDLATNKKGILRLDPVNGGIRLFSKQGLNKSSQLSLSDVGAHLTASDPDVAATLSVEPNNVQITTSNPAANTQLSMSGGTASLESLGSSAKVSLSNTEASLSFGNQKFRIGATGFSIGNNALAVLLPVAPLPNAAAIANAASQQAQAMVQMAKVEMQLKLNEARETLEKKISDEVAAAKMNVDQKVVDASAEEGAKPA